MEVIAPNGVRIYNISASRSLPSWISDKKKKALKKNEDYRRRIELIQDFDFPITGNNIKMSRDGQYILATGIYPPQVRCYEVSQLSMKFKRHIDCEVIKFQILSDDFTKLAFLRTDRVLEFHASFGTYYNMRIPKVGRDMMYSHATCELFTVGASPDIYRVNLEQGRFLKPWQSCSSSVNACGINPANSLFAFAGDDGILECWDPRERKAIGALPVGHDIMGASSGFVTSPASLSAVRFSNDGMMVGVGSHTGHVALYDIRTSVPLRVKDHQYGTPIVDIKFHEPTRNVVSSCKKAIRIWNKDDGTSFCSVEPPSDINDVCLVKDTGMILVACEQKRMCPFYIPSLGHAPKWCSFLDNLTEELEEEKNQTVYQDYKFVTREDLERLGVTNLIGTPYLRASMHGYFMDVRLYTKIRAIANPDEYKDYLKSRIKKRIEEKRASRIRAQKTNNLPKVNKELAVKASAEDDPKAAKVKSLMEDDRFKKLFEDPTFQIDKTNDAYRRHHPNEKPEQEKEDDFDLVSDEDEDNESGDDEMREDQEESDEDSDESEEPQPKKPQAKQNNYAKAGNNKAIGQNRRKVQMFEAKEDGNPILNNKKKEEMRNKARQAVSFEKRLQVETVKNASESRVPNKPLSMTFVNENAKRRGSSSNTKPRGPKRQPNRF
jgi:ribosome biogenesis protein ENP2